MNSSSNSTELLQKSSLMIRDIACYAPPLQQGGKNPAGEFFYNPNLNIYTSDNGEPFSTMKDRLMI